MAITLEDIKARKEARRKALQRSLEHITGQLRDMGALKVIVFGSFASGEITSLSDLDLIVVMPSTQSGREWMGKIYEEVDREVDCDILAYTREELEKMLPVSGILRSALSSGRTVYEAGR
jgi:predicted nucleotidyltransferase